MNFEQPISGDWLKPADRNGHLILIIKVHEIVPHFDKLKGGDVDRASFDYVDLDEPGQQLHVRADNTHPGIVKKLHASLRGGDAVLGRIVQVPTDKGNPAWVLGPYDETGTDAQRATAWIEQAAQILVHQPQAATPAPAVTPAVTPVATPAVPPAVTAAVTPAPRPAAIDVASLTDEQRAKLAALGIG